MQTLLVIIPCTSKSLLAFNVKNIQLQAFSMPGCRPATHQLRRTFARDLRHRAQSCQVAGLPAQCRCMLLHPELGQHQFKWSNSCAQHRSQARRLRPLQQRRPLITADGASRDSALLDRQCQGEASSSCLLQILCMLRCCHEARCRRVRRRSTALTY